MKPVLAAVAFALMTVVFALSVTLEGGPPDEIFGAKRVFCQEGPAAECCGYDGVDHEGDPCGIVLCRGNGSDEWHIVMARCFRQKSQSEQQPKDEESI